MQPAPVQFMAPYPISANRYWRNYQGRMRPSDEAREYQRAVAYLARAAGLRTVHTLPVALTLLLHPRRPKDWRTRAKRDPQWWDMGVLCVDTDNCIKVAVDALQGVAYANDRLVWRLEVERCAPMDAGGLFVIVRPLRPGVPAVPAPETFTLETTHG